MHHLDAREVLQQERLCRRGSRDVWKTLHLPSSLSWTQSCCEQLIKFLQLIVLMMTQVSWQDIQTAEARREQVLTKAFTKVVEWPLFLRWLRFLNENYQKQWNSWLQKTFSLHLLLSLTVQDWAPGPTWKARELFEVVLWLPHTCWGMPPPTRFI